jgi:hypothetical protein
VNAAERLEIINELLPMLAPTASIEPMIEVLVAAVVQARYLRVAYGSATDCACPGCALIHAVEALGVRVEPAPWVDPHPFVMGPGEPLGPRVAELMDGFVEIPPTEGGAT